MLNRGPRTYAQMSLVLVMSADSAPTLVSSRDALSSGTSRMPLVDPRTSSLGDTTTRALSTLNPAYKRRAPILPAPRGEDIIHLLQTGKADAGLGSRIDTMNRGQMGMGTEAPIEASETMQSGQDDVA